MKVSMEQCWNDIDGGKSGVLGEKPVPVPLCLPEISNGLLWDRTLAPALRGRQNSHLSYVTVFDYHKYRRFLSVNFSYVMYIKIQLPPHSKDIEIQRENQPVKTLGK